MKVTAFNGSPRAKGNTAVMLRAALAPIAAAGIETELVQVGGTKIHGCTACGQCFERKDRRCVFDDDVLNGLLAKMVASDGILLGSPSYFSSMTPEMKALIDRAGFVALANGGLLARKVGAAVAVHRRGGAVNIMDQINHLFLISRMIVPGSTYWNFGVGMDEGDVAGDEEAMANMQDLGEQFVWLLGKLNA